MSESFFCLFTFAEKLVYSQTTQMLWLCKLGTTLDTNIK